MRLLLTTDTIGGVWTFTKDLTTELLTRGHAVALISFGRPPSQTQSAWAKTTHTTYPETFHFAASEAPLEWMQQNDHAYSAALPHLLELAARFNPDLIHTSQFCFGFLPLRIPTIITAHSDVLSWATACDPTALEPSPWLTRYKHLVQQGLSAATAVVAPTNWMLEALRTGFQITSPTHVILNGRNLPTPDSTQPRHLQAISAGRLWDKAKNLTLLTTLDLTLPILVAGDQHHDGTHIPSANLTLLGPLDQPALLDLFRSSAFYIVPSLYEPFGLAPLEAAQCGCAILAHDIPSLREVWGESALYFHTPDQLSQALHHILTSKTDRKSAQIASQTHAQTLTATRMTTQYLQLYHQLLNHTAPPPTSTQPIYVQ